MSLTASVVQQAEPLIEILAAQCTDLEALLRLAQRETAAAERKNFGEMMQVIDERATLGDRLEVYHRQIAEMRTRLSDASLTPILSSEVAQQTVRLAADIQAQDARTRPLLLQARTDTLLQLNQTQQSRKGVGAYLREGYSPASIACDQRV